MNKQKFKKMALVTSLVLTMVTTSVVPAMAASTSTTMTASKVRSTKIQLEDADPYNYNTIRVEWDKIKGLSGYQIYRSTSKYGKYTKIRTLGKDSYFALRDSGRTPGKRYYYKVRGYKRINGKLYFTKFSDVESSYARPSKTVMTEVYGGPFESTTGYLEWKPVAGATGYMPEVNQYKDGKWSGWRKYSYDWAGDKSTFETYNTILSYLKKQYPSGYTTEIVGHDKNGYPILERMTIAKAAELSIPKNEARIDICQDDTIYKFRVRPYTVVNGKRVYGLASDEMELKETLDLDKIKSELRAYAIEYSDKYYPEFDYDDTRGHSTSEDSSYYVDGAFGIFSRYARTDDVIESFKENIRLYISSVIEGGGMETGFIYIKRSKPGDQEGMSSNDGPETYYKVWMLY